MLIEHTYYSYKLSMTGNFRKIFWLLENDLVDLLNLKILYVLIINFEYK